MNTFFKRIFNFIKQHPVRYIGSLILMMVSSVAVIYPARIIGQVVDQIVKGTLTAEWLIAQLVVLVGVIAVAYAAESAWTYMIFIGYYEIQQDLRVKLLRNNLRKKIPFYAHFRTGDIITRSSEDVSTMGEVMGFGTYATLNSSFMLIVTLSMMITTVSLPLTIAALIPMPILSYFVYKWGYEVEEEYSKAQAAVSELNNEVLEMIDGNYVVRAYGQEEAMIGAFREKTEVAMKKNIRVGELDSRFMPLAEFIAMLSFIIGISYGGYLVSQGAIQVGDVIAFQVYMSSIMWPIFLLGDILSTYKRGKVASSRIQELEVYDDGLERGGQRTLRRIESIEFQQFSFTYPGEKQPMLKEIDVKIGEGETLGIVGKTGSGKTTLLTQLLHQFPYNGQSISINDVPFVEYRENDVAHQIAYVPQEHILFSRSIRENMYFGKANVTDDEIWAALKLAAFDKDVRRMPEGLDTIVGEKGVSLSGGQKQRLSIARALLRNRECLILDDALSAVDAKTEREIIEHLQAERKEGINLIASHRLSAIRHANEIIVLSEGRIIERGTHEELLDQKGWYYEQYNIQELEEEFE